MPVTQIDICNLALRKMGAKTIMSLDDGTEESDACKDLYDHTLEVALTDHEWNFALFRTQLAQVVFTKLTDGEFDNKYAFPSDPFCFRPIRFLTGNLSGESAFEAPQPSWRVEGRFILTNEDTVFITYLGLVTDTAQYPPLFARALATLLASDLALDLVQDQRMSDGLFNKWIVARGRAVIEDGRGQQQNPDREVDEWIHAGRGTTKGRSIVRVVRG